MSKCICGEDFENQFLLNEHQKNNCRNRYIHCQLCDEIIQSCDMNHHLFYCASKTNKCPNCSKYIRRAIYNYHLENNCKDSDEDLLTLDKNDIQSNDDILIPCEVCDRQIKFSSYEYHLKTCFSNKTRSRSNFELPRSIIDYSAYEQNVDNDLKNSSTTDKITRRTDVVSKLKKKTNDVRDTLGKYYYSNEIEHATNKLQFNILLMGSPRVGKSQLINALCNEEELAETSSSLNSCTKEIKCYILEDNQERIPGIEPFRINFYDTPGIESWIKGNGQETMLKFIEEKDPVCLIYCASPGSFADLKQLQPVLKFCKNKQIFCALVCTNMWSGNKRHEVIKDFEKELEFFGDRIEKLFDQGYDRLPHKVIIFGHGAFCTMVNSKEYSDQELSNKDMPVQGIDELIHCIMEELDEEKLLGWCNAALYRRTYWEKLTQRVNGFYSKHLSNFIDKTADQMVMRFTIYLVGKFFNRK